MIWVIGTLPSLHLLVKSLPERISQVWTLLNSNILVWFIEKSFPLSRKITTPQRLLLWTRMIRFASTSLLPRRNWINVFLRFRIAVINLDDCTRLLPENLFRLRSQCSPLMLTLIRRVIDHIFMSFFRVIIEHPDEQIVSIIVRVRLLEVVTDYTSIRRLNRPTSVFLSRLEVLNFTEFCEFHLNRILLFDNWLITYLPPPTF